VSGHHRGDREPTIFALSSGPPPCAIAVIRMSGPDAFACAERLTGMALPPPRQAALRRFRDPADGALVDEGLLLRMDAETSITGEPLVELHCHGSRAIVRDLQDILGRFEGLRPAGAGEFTRRAFLNGRMDLAAVEGLGDLLAAETTHQRQAALAMMGGQLGREIDRWAQALLRLSAMVEARLDFSDEGDVESADTYDAAADCAGLAAEMRAALDRPLADRLREGVRVAIGGPPNVGKSTLFNALIGRDAAIVSPQPGTTRDVIEATISLGGVAFLLSDSAGLRETGDAVESIGVARAETLLQGADIILWAGASDARPDVDGHVIQLRTRADLSEDAGSGCDDGLAVSAVTGEGLGTLVSTLCAAASDILPRPGDYALSRRQHECLARAHDALVDAAGQEDDVLLAEALRQALAALDELTGRATTEAVLGEIFSGFCIGK